METEKTKWTYKGWPGCNNLVEGHDDYPYAAKIGIGGSSGNAAIAVVYGTSNEDVDQRAQEVVRRYNTQPALVEAMKECVTDPGARAWDGPELAWRRLRAINEVARAALRLADGQAQLEGGK